MRGPAYVYMRGESTNLLYKLKSDDSHCLPEKKKYLSSFHNQSFDTLMISEHRQVSNSSNMKQTDTRDNYVINKASNGKEEDEERFSGSSFAIKKQSNKKARRSTIG